MIEQLSNIRMRALALRSSVHNEQQLSAIELCGMVAKKTNELIDVMNDLCDYVENLQKTNNLSVTYDEKTESLKFGG